MTDEIWKEIPSLPLYEISSKGRMRSWRKSGNGKGRRDEPRILSLNYSTGYPYTTITIDGERITVRIHTLVNTVFNGEPEKDGLYTLHKDDDPLNNVPSNLYWGTAQDNANDKIRHGNQAKGSKQGSSKLTENEVLEIRAAYRLGVFTQKEIAEAYDVARRTVGAVITKQNWAHI